MDYILSIIASILGIVGIVRSWCNTKQILKLKIEIKSKNTMIGILNNGKDTVMKGNTFIQGNNISSEGDVLIYKSSSHFMGGMLMEYHIYKTKDHKYYGVLPSKGIVGDICLNTNDALSNIQNKTINA